jgi:D-cysteine desulfhydrase family pyridoxal phosphate-dependent enzyme
MKESLQAKLDSYPKIHLARYPTPLEFLPNLSAEVGREIYIKRDDEIGPGMGGNKTRKLEFLLGEAVQRGFRKIATFGGLQSNHARITAAAGRKCGLEPHLFYFERRPSSLRGNLLLNQVMGASMHFIPFGGGGNGSMTLETTIRLVRLFALLRLGPHYFVPVGGHTWLGCLGYVQAALEIDRQSRGIGIENAWLAVAAGSGGTLAGLLAGLHMIDSQLKPIGIDVGRLWKEFPQSIARLANEICQQLGYPLRFSAGQVPLIEETYVGECYGSPTGLCLAGIQKLAQMEGILLDPIYTGKAFSGLLDLIANNHLGDWAPVIFLHTGGLPALFAFDDRVILG